MKEDPATCVHLRIDMLAGRVTGCPEISGGNKKSERRDNEGWRS